MEETTGQSPLFSVRTEIVRRFNEFQANKRAFWGVLLSLGVILGIFSGWLLAEGGVGRTSRGQIATSPGEKEAGLADEATFRDSAEGKLEGGGIEGEGTHHLVRDGGPSQYVYLTSTVIDLSLFKEKKVRVWGETIAARKAGWLMDVGKIKVLE